MKLSQLQVKMIESFNNNNDNNERRESAFSKIKKINSNGNKVSFSIDAILNKDNSKGK